MACLVMAVLTAMGPGRMRLALAQDDPAAGSPPGIQTVKDKIKINFPEMDLESVLKNFSAITGKSFILEQVPKGQIRTIGPIGPVEVPKEQALRLFVLIMDMNGYVVVKTSVDNVFKVVRKAEAGKDNIELYPPGTAPEPTENMVTRFIQLRYISAPNVVTQLSPMTTKDGGQVLAYAPLNMLIVMDTAINIERMLKVLRIIDVPSPEPEIEFITLEYATPGEVAGILSQIFQTAPGTPAPRTATTRPTSRSRRGRSTAPTPAPVPIKAGGGGAEGPKFIPVERINALIVIADEDTMAAILEMICRIDVDLGTAGTIHVYYVQNAEATELAATLSGLAGGGRGASTASRTTASRTTGRGASTPSQPSRSSRSGAATTSLQGILSDEVSITSDEATNSLIVVATPADWKILKDVILKLDIPRRQVFVEAVLLEITFDEAQQVGISMHGGSPLENDGMIVAGTGFSDVSSIGILNQLAAAGGALPNGITVGALASPLEVPGTDGLVTIPSAGIVLRMLATYSDVNVLSTPTLLTTDNKEASIEVGQKIPVPTGQTVSTGGFSNVSISRESVGIKLKLTPHINDSDNIRMEIFVEISGAIQSGLGIDVNQLGVTTSNKTAETEVIVKNGQTIVIGGLMQDTEDEGISWVPFLGEIPVLGALFRNTSRHKLKTNLIILLTPHIVRSHADVVKVSRYLEQGYKDMEIESKGETDPDRVKHFKSQVLENEYTIIEPSDGYTGTFEGAPAPDWDWTVEPKVLDEDESAAAGRSATTRETWPPAEGEASP